MDLKQEFAAFLTGDPMLGPINVCGPTFFILYQGGKHCIGLEAESGILFKKFYFWGF